MRPSRLAVSVLTTFLAVAAWTASGTEPEDDPNVGPNSTRVDRSSGTASRLSRKQTPEAAARTQFNIGSRVAEKGDELGADAAQETDAAKREKLEARSRAAYENALETMTKATRHNPRMFEAWSAVGTLNRKLGRHDAALVAYDRAQTLKADQAEVIDGRARAYLALNRVEDAKRAYATLAAGDRALAAQLLEAMRAYVGERRAAAGSDAAQLDALSAWISERSAAAG